MKKTVSLFTEDMYVHCASFSENCGVRLWLPEDVEESMLGNKVKVELSSYPVYRNGHCYPIDFEIDFTKQNCIELFGDIVYPIVERLAQEYDKMVEATEIKDCPHLINEVHKGEEYECWHSFDDLRMERLTYSPDKKTISVFIGS